jgi:hypothetical protein
VKPVYFYIASSVFLFSCKKETTIPYPADFTCHYNNLIFSSDTSLSIDAFYPVKAGNWWSYDVYKYSGDSLDTSYHTTSNLDITGIITTQDSIWQFNGNSNYTYGKSSAGIFTLVPSANGCYLPDNCLVIPAGSDTVSVVHYVGTAGTPLTTLFYRTGDTLVTPAGTFYNPVVVYNDYFSFNLLTYYVQDIGIVKMVEHTLSGIHYERVLNAYHFN